MCKVRIVQIQISTIHERHSMTRPEMQFEKKQLSSKKRDNESPETAFRNVSFKNQNTLLFSS